jgi:hypothetical protein
LSYSFPGKDILAAVNYFVCKWIVQAVENVLLGIALEMKKIIALMKDSVAFITL